MRLVKEQTGYHLGFLLKDQMKMLSEITSDPLIFADVFRALCSEQIKERGLSDHEFYLTLDGDGAVDATQALWSALEDFSPSQIREALRNLANKADQVKELAILQIAEKSKEFAEMDPEKILTAIYTRTVSDSLESSASTPGEKPFAS